MTVSQQVEAGLGKHLESLSIKDVAKYAKAIMGREVLIEDLLTFNEIEYGSYFLCIATVSLANATGVVFGLMLEPGSPHL